MDTKRVMVKGGDLDGHPGYWTIVESIEGESDSWFVIRKPDGTFWEVARVDYFPRNGATVTIDIGDQILDRRLIAQCQDYYSQLRQKAEESFAVGARDILPKNSYCCPKSTDKMPKNASY